MQGFFFKTMRNAAPAAPPEYYLVLAADHTAASAAIGAKVLTEDRTLVDTKKMPSELLPFFDREEGDCLFWATLI